VKVFKLGSEAKIPDGTIVTVQAVYLNSSKYEAASRDPLTVTYLVGTGDQSFIDEYRTDFEPDQQLKATNDSVFYPDLPT
jgi:hypothetical protein